MIMVLKCNLHLMLPDHLRWNNLRNLGSLKTSSLTNTLRNLRNLGSLKTSSLINRPVLGNVPVLDNTFRGFAKARD